MSLGLSMSTKSTVAASVSPSKVKCTATAEFLRANHLFIIIRTPWQKSSATIKHKEIPYSGERKQASAEFCNAAVLKKIAASINTRAQKAKKLQFFLDKGESLCYNLSCSCGCSSSGRAPPCQGGGSEFEPRHPLHKQSLSLTKAVFIFIKVQYNKQNKKRKSTCKSKCLFWSYWPDSNRRPADYESAALPTEPQ